MASVRGLPCEPPNKSSAVFRCRATRTPATIASVRFLPSSIKSGIWKPAESTSRRPCVMNQNGQHRPHAISSSGCKVEVYHFRFLFAIEEFTGARGQMTALDGSDRHPESMAGWCKKPCADCGTAEATTYQLGHHEDQGRGLLWTDRLGNLSAGFVPRTMPKLCPLCPNYAHSNSKC